MSWNESTKGEPESTRMFNNICQWGLIAGLLVKVRSMSKGKRVKQKLPDEGTEEFNALVKEGIWTLKALIFGALIGAVFTIIQLFKRG